MKLFRPSRSLAQATILGAVLLVPALASAETLSPEAAVRRAAAQNPSLKAALLDVAAAKHAVRAEENTRVPTFVASVQGSYSEAIGADTRSDSEALSGKAAVTYTTDIGTSIEAGVESNAAWRNINAFGADTFGAGPTFSSDAYVSVRQPILRGAGEDVMLGSLVQAQSSQTQSELQREQVASQTALDVLSAYWELWYADQAVAVQEQALAIANKQLADAQAREATLGVGSRVDVLQFATQAASIDDALSQARTTRATRAIMLGKTLGMAPAESMALDASEEAPVLSAARSTRAPTLARNPQILGLRSQLEAADARVVTAEDANQPRLDVFAKVAVGASWTDDSYAGASLPGGRPAFMVLGGIEFELPLGENRASSDVARAKASRDAAKERYQATSDTVAAELGSLDVQLGSADRQVELAAMTAKISSQLAEAQRQKLELGTGSPSEVVKAEQTAREAELRRLRAVVSRATTELSFEHSSGALLDRFGSLFGGRSS